MLQMQQKKQPFAAFDAHLLHIYCTFTAHLLHIYCTFTAHLLHIYCTFTVLATFAALAAVASGI
jgi:hypothetical protein